MHCGINSENFEIFPVRNINNTIIENFYTLDKMETLIKMSIPWTGKKRHFSEKIHYNI